MPQNAHLIHINSAFSPIFALSGYRSSIFQTKLRVHVTRHARERMAQRNINEALLGELLETGQVRYKDDIRLWIAKEAPGRQDNLICAAVILEEMLVVKTVMHHFQWES